MKTTHWWVMSSACCNQLLAEEWIGTCAEAEQHARELAELHGCTVNYHTQFASSTEQGSVYLDAAEGCSLCVELEDAAFDQCSCGECAVCHPHRGVLFAKGFLS